MLDQRFDAAERGGALPQASPAPRRRSPRRGRRARGSTACRRSRLASAARRSRGRDGRAGRDRALRRRRRDWTRRCARSSALAAAARTRRSSVRRPRISRNASNGPRIRPCSLRMSAARAASPSARAKPSAPAIASEWPLRYLVAECMTTSAPSSSGRVKIGVAQVEVDRQRRPCRMRDRRRRGDVGDAPQRIARRLQPDETRRLLGDAGFQARRGLRGRRTRPRGRSSALRPSANGAAPNTSVAARRRARPARGSETARSPPTCPSRRQASRRRLRASRSAPRLRARSDCRAGRRSARSNRRRRDRG